jgi:hypothetical protein
VTPFDSTKFFDDEFFLPSQVDIGLGFKVRGILIDELDPERHGNLIGRPGHWAMLYLMTKDVPAVCEPGFEFVIDGVTWRKDSATDQGDVTEVVVMSDQRKR